MKSEPQPFRPGISPKEYKEKMKHILMNKSVLEALKRKARKEEAEALDNFLGKFTAAEALE